MSKRRAVEPCAGEEDEYSGGTHTYPAIYHTLCLSLLRHPGMTPAKLSKYEGAPAERTLRNWVHARQDPSKAERPQKIGGRPPILTEEQLSILGGFVLFCAEEHQPCTARDIED